MAKKLTIEAEDGSSKFELMLNPSNFSHNHVIQYDKKSKKSLGKSASETKFAGYDAETIDFMTIIDGTGVVKTTKPVDVTQQVSDLKDVIYNYIGNKHEPNIVHIVWGTLYFVCRLTSFKVEYVLFKPDGTPLRAKVNLSFSGYMTNKEEALNSKRSSPDLTHVIEFKAGDTLPLLCHQVYQDGSYYMQVAKINNLASFRQITPGTKLFFPPLL
ncbi:peptidoglycan-binding protein [Shewanella sp. VB17]|uniref:CIS tube protein n=1 Tax=Shewanella sp. VB17 TaxID=2739432 RepID=UPI0015651AAF|nr:peptidoglycan-binding protein [Shewanella sp. VB17]NRD75156.1 peptidoglycan-binding protein [Shewanella sp. VB17]